MLPSIYTVPWDHYLCLYFVTRYPKWRLLACFHNYWYMTELQQYYIAANS